MVEPLRVKICGVTRREDAVAAERAGADYVGVILSAGFSRSVDPTEAAALVAGLEPVAVAVLVDEDRASAEAAARSLGAGVIQLHGDEPPSLLADLRARGDWKLWKSVRARTAADVAHTVERYAGLVHGILVEGWKEGVTGGGGVRLGVDHAAVRASVPDDVELILAGGLTPDTVAHTVEAFRPQVVDVSSGVESAVREKDHELVSRFVERARAAASPSTTVDAALEEPAR